MGPAYYLLIWTTCEYELFADGTNGFFGFFCWHNLLRAFSGIGIQFVPIANPFEKCANASFCKFGCEHRAYRRLHHLLLFSVRRIAWMDPITTNGIVRCGCRSGFFAIDFGLAIESDFGWYHFTWAGGRYCHVHVDARLCPVQHHDIAESYWCFHHGKPCVFGSSRRFSRLYGRAPVDGFVWQQR